MTSTRTLGVPLLMLVSLACTALAANVDQQKKSDVNIPSDKPYLPLGPLHAPNLSGPLMLTPLIQEGNIRLAQQRSLVGNIPELQIDSYSGFITANASLGNHLFFWFCPSVKNPSTSPLLLWLNGGPGVSSMQGFLWENGPLDIMPGGSRRRPAVPRDVFWAQEFSTLYIDSPVGVGYSFSESGKAGWRTMTEDTAKDLLNVLEQFYLLFPEYQNRELYIGGQSYAGKYCTALAFLIHSELEAGRTRLPLAGIYIGGPFLKPEVNLPSDLQMYYNLGAMSKSQWDGLSEILSSYVDAFYNGTFTDGVIKVVTTIYPEAMNLLTSDNFVSRESIDDPGIVSWMTSFIVREAAHIGPDLQFSNFKTDVFDSFGLDLFVNYDAKLGVLMDNYKVMVYTSDYDLTVSNLGVEKIVYDIPWSQQDEYRNASRKIWSVGPSDKPTLRGTFTAVGQFCRVNVHGAGHQVPRDAPEAMFQLISEFVKHGCLQT